MASNEPTTCGLSSVHPPDADNNEESASNRGKLLSQKFWLVVIVLLAWLPPPPPQDSVVAFFKLQQGISEKATWIGCHQFSNLLLQLLLCCFNGNEYPFNPTTTTESRRDSKNTHIIN